MPTQEARERLELLQGTLDLLILKILALEPRLLTEGVLRYVKEASDLLGVKQPELPRPEEPPSEKNSARPDNKKG